MCVQDIPTYSALGGSASPYVLLDSNTGVIYLVKELDSPAALLSVSGPRLL